MYEYKETHAPFGLRMVDAKTVRPKRVLSTAQSIKPQHLRSTGWHCQISVLLDCFQTSQDARSAAFGCRQLPTSHNFPLDYTAVKASCADCLH